MAKPTKYRPPADLPDLRRRAKFGRDWLKKATATFTAAKVQHERAAREEAARSLALARAEGVTPVQARALVEALANGDDIDAPEATCLRLVNLGYASMFGPEWTFLTDDGRKEAKRLRKAHPELSKGAKP